MITELTNLEILKKETMRLVKVSIRNFRNILNFYAAPEPVIGKSFANQNRISN